MAVGHAARLVDHRDHRNVGRALAIAHRHVDRQRLLHRRVQVAPGAEAVAAADHDESLAQVADVHLERGHGRIAELRCLDVVEHDRVVAGERGERRRYAARRHDGHLQAALAEGGDEVGGAFRIVGGDQHLGLAGHEDVGIGGIVLGEAVIGRLDHRAEDVESGLFGRHRERDGGDARLELQLPGRDRGAVGQQPQRGARW